MRINLAYGAMIGILAASFGVLGPATAQASAIAGTSVPAASHHAVSTDRTAQRSDRCGWWGDCCWGWRCGFDHGGFDHGGFDHGGFDHGGFDHGGFDHGGFRHGGFDHGGFRHGGFDHGGFDHGGFRR
jgi:hypothetical protein